MLRSAGADGLAREALLLRGRADEGGAVRRPRRVPLGQAECDDRDVVPPPCGVGVGDEAVDRLLERVGLGDDLRDPRLLDHRREPVRADQVHVARPGAIGHRVHLDLRLGAESPRDDRTLRMVLGLRVREPPLPAQLLDQRMVGGEELQLTVAPPVRAAVADMGEAQFVAVQQSRGEGRPHARSRGVRLREPVDPRVCILGDPAQVGLGRDFDLGVGGERLRRDPRGDLPRLGPAHPVGDGEERRVRVVGVLVRASLPADVGSVGLLDYGEHLRRSGVHELVHPGDVELEPQLRIADPNLVEVPHARLPVEACAVQERAVRGVHVLNVVAAAARVETRVDA